MANPLYGSNKADAKLDGMVDAQDAIASLTDDTGGTAGSAVNDTTSSVKDDIASLAAKINAILVALRAAGVIKS